MKKVFIFILILIIFGMTVYVYSINKSIVATKQDLILAKQKEINLVNELEIIKAEKKLNDQKYEPVIEDLIAHPELISVKGVLGGKMGFYSKEDIYVFNDRWVIARFDDGHILGAMILRYSRNDKGKMKWEILDEFLIK